MDEAIRELLEAADDPVHTESPPDLDWETLEERLNRLAPKLSRIAHRSFDLDDTAQDATFFGDLSTHRSMDFGVIEAILAVRFSNFGSLFTTFESETERLPEKVVSEIVDAVTYAGFHYVPKDALGTSYTGRNPDFEGAKWWDRFFDYI